MLVVVAAVAAAAAVAAVVVVVVRLHRLLPARIIVFFLLRKVRHCGPVSRAEKKIFGARVVGIRYLPSGRLPEAEIRRRHLRRAGQISV